MVETLGEQAKNVLKTSESEIRRIRKNLKELEDGLPHLMRTLFKAIDQRRPLAGLLDRLLAMLQRAQEGLPALEAVQALSHQYPGGVLSGYEPNKGLIPMSLLEMLEGPEFGFESIKPRGSRRVTL